MTARHQWSDPTRFHNDRGEKTKSERTCQRCALVKVTFFPPPGFGPPWQRFYREGSAEALETMPVCEGVDA